jgi:twitching motility protein PilT
VARLDRLIQVLHEQRADALRLAVGKPAALVTNGSARPLTKEPLTDGQILTLVREVADPASAPRLGGSEAVSFPYSAPSGQVTVAFTPGAGGPLVEVRAQPAAGSASGAATVGGRGAAELAEARAAMDDLFRLLVDAGASDLHLRSGEPPLLRHHGALARQDRPALSAERLETMLISIMTPREIAEFREIGDTDWAYEIPELARFRCNAGRDRHGPIAVFRVIPTTVRTADEMGLSREVQNLCYLTKGLVVVTGPTGSGKSTTLAALVDLMNRTRNDHIITIEDPIEFVHQS